jgi:hypothetical protein
VDLATVANLAEASAVIVAVIFGIVQLRQLRHQQRREAAFTLMRSIQSPQMLRGILIIDRLPTDAGKEDFDALSQADQADLTALLATWESLGILVFNREVSLHTVCDFFSGTIAQSWRKLQRYVSELREQTSRDTRWEWFQWLAERMREDEASVPPVPAYLEHRNWKRHSKA